MLEGFIIIMLLSYPNGDISAVNASYNTEVFRSRAACERELNELERDPDYEISIMYGLDGEEQIFYSVEMGDQRLTLTCMNLKAPDG
ncbi:MAG: hypothetical protein CL850_05285 [Crocinitomicaceae bacterium]|jgi:hypothetical protein|nr:hypothetical protein [Crocinitomicaceae bacterium]|tara:strand:+ start:290 stop:550 length:261 start_codon:yes stop_codon:yes gene_type:complete